MSINPILIDSIDKGFINTCTHSVTLAANQVLWFRLEYRKAATPAVFTTFTWNGIQCTMHLDEDSRDVRCVSGYIKATVGATANLVSNTSAVFAAANLTIAVVESTTNSFLSNPIKAAYTSKSDTETSYVLPSIAATGLAAGDFIIAALTWLGQDKAYANVQSTTAAPSAPLTLSDSVQNSNNLNSPGRSYLSTATGLTGSQTFAHTKTGAGSPMYNYAVVVLYESLYLINTLTSPLVPGGAFSGTCTGFANGAATISSGGVSVAVTIASGAFSGIWPMPVDGAAYPVLPATGQTITLTQGANSATILNTISIPAGYSAVTFVDAITADNTYLGKFIQEDGFTVNGGQFVYLPYNNTGTPGDQFIVNPDSGFTVVGNGTVTGWFRPSTGTGAGNTYLYTFNIVSGAVVSSARIKALPITAEKITALPITAEKM
jgi:hypothetical protein